MKHLTGHNRFPLTQRALAVYFKAKPPLDALCDHAMTPADVEVYKEHCRIEHDKVRIAFLADTSEVNRWSHVKDRSIGEIESIRRSGADDPAGVRAMMNIERVRKHVYRATFRGRLKGSQDPLKSRTVLIPALNGIAARINVKLLYEVKQ